MPEGQPNVALAGVKILTSRVVSASYSDPQQSLIPSVRGASEMRRCPVGHAWRPRVNRDASGYFGTTARMPAAVYVSSRDERRRFRVGPKEPGQAGCV